MPNVELTLSAATAIYRQGGYMKGGWSFSLSASLDHSLRQEIELTTDDKFVGLVGRVGFSNDEGEPYGGHLLGSLSYWKGHDDSFSPTPPSYLVELRLPQGDVEKIMAYAMAGRVPRSLSISVPMELGWALDGSMKKWDNRKNRVLPIEDFSLSYGEDSSVAHYDEGDDEPRDAPPVVRKNSSELTALVSIGRYILVLLLVICALLVFH